MHFYGLSSRSTCPLNLGVGKSPWLGISKPMTMYYEQCEKADEFIGTCLMLGVPITFIKIDASVEVPENVTVYIYSSSEPMVATTLTGRLITLYPSSYLSSDESH
ncbi:hypothetical protein LD35_gp59 [Escherichia phage vB_EcoP_PhAPEC7]|uniref:Uncharacterized protein n=1 Tax=Escherichia phage vB_EcoP_PhAPEC7 TaxID=1391223 RepID=A0A067ZK33_9CAUD|nr:hypothetical protein LD35_gp59 [Escherichia phage vB_EcoP_PhAPEC7]AHV82702.1 hypothetical protein PhAPEC7_78 [Escherichia phage vB_EcoP_PhAPEC7]